MFSVKTRLKRRGWIGALLAVGLCAPLPLGAQTQADSDFDKTVSQGEAAFARGWLDEAILYWTGALDAAVKLRVTGLASSAWRMTWFVISPCISTPKIVCSDP